MITATPMDGPVKLAADRRERAPFEALADLYSVMFCMEHLEKAFAKDAVTRDEYAQQCDKLLSQWKLLKASAPADFRQEDFFREWNLEETCPSGIHRIRAGISATAEFRAGAAAATSSSSGSATSQTKQVAEAVQFFITVMDSLKLDMNAVDQLHPLLSDLVEAIGRCGSFLPPSYETSARKVSAWFAKLNEMRATDTLSPEDVRQMLFDLDSAYSSFHKALQI